MSYQLSQIAFFGAMFLSVINIVAGVIGLGPAVTAATGMKVPLIITIGLALYGAVTLIYCWVKSFMSNRAGMALYYCNLLVAPFGYMLLGLPTVIAIALAASPVPFYHGVGWISDLVRQKDG